MKIPLRFFLPAALWLTLSVPGLAADVATAALPGLQPAPMSGKDAKVFDVLKALNQIPQEQVSEKTAPAVTVVQTLYDLDAPDFSTLRRLLARADVRGNVNPTVKALLAGILSTRWDCYSLAGNLWLGALRSPNPDARTKARVHLVNFIQPAHIPVLINLLKTPGPNVLAFEILEEVSGQRLEPSVKSWSLWWKQTGGKADLVGHLLNTTATHLKDNPIHPFVQARFWYLPEGVEHARVAFAKRPAVEQNFITQWNEWANSDVKRYVDEFSESKPVLDRIVHQPDPRVDQFLEKLVADPAYGDYASVLLAWRRNHGALPAIGQAYTQLGTVGRALARGSLGDKTALSDLLKTIEEHREPLSYGLMDDALHSYMEFLHTVAVIPAEQAFELLSHQTFGFRAANTRNEKKKAFRKAEKWLRANLADLTFDSIHGYFSLAGTTH